MTMITRRENLLHQSWAFAYRLLSIRLLKVIPWLNYHLRRLLHWSLIVNKHWVNVWAHEVWSLSRFQSQPTRRLFILRSPRRTQTNPLTWTALSRSSAFPTWWWPVPQHYLKGWLLKALQQFLLSPQSHQIRCWRVAVRLALEILLWRRSVRRLRDNILVKLSVKGMLLSDVKGLMLGVVLRVRLVLVNGALYGALVLSGIVVRLSRESKFVFKGLFLSLSASH